MAVVTNRGVRSQLDEVSQGLSEGFSELYV